MSFGQMTSGIISMISAGKALHGIVKYIGWKPDRTQGKLPLASGR